MQGIMGRAWASCSTLITDVLCSCTGIMEKSLWVKVVSVYVPFAHAQSICKVRTRACPLARGTRQDSLASLSSAVSWALLWRSLSRRLRSLSSRSILQSLLGRSHWLVAIAIGLISLVVLAQKDSKVQKGDVNLFQCARMRTLSGLPYVGRQTPNFRLS